VKKEVLISNEQLQAVFEQAAVGMVIVDAAQSRFVKVNRRFCEIVGYSAEELLQGSIHDITHPDDFRMDLNHVEPISAGVTRESSWEKRYRKKDGTVIWARAFVTPLDPSEAKPTLRLGVIEEITEQRRMEEALRESQAFYHSLVEQLPAGVFRKDHEGRYVFVSPWFCRLKGMKEEEFLGKTPQEVAASEAAKLDTTGQVIKYAPQGEDHHVRIMQTGKPIELVEEYADATGGKQFVHVIKIPVFNSEGKVIGTQGVLFDITERKRVEEALRWSETQLQATLESTADGILALDNEGRMIKTNRRFADLWRIPQSLMDAGDDRALLDYMMNQLSDPDTFLKNVRLLDNSDRVNMDTLAFRDGRVFEHFSFRMIMEGVVIGRVWSFRDITERRRMEEALKESENRYRELSIVDDLTQLYNARHFYHQLKMEIDRVDRYGQPLTLLLLDLDDFKTLNDTYGHVEGDRVLSRLGRFVKDYLRRTDSAYRYGGEEFTLLLPMTTSADGSVTAERIRSKFRQEDFFPVPGQNIHVTVSIGIAQYRPQEDMKAFVHRVDQLMYQAKKNGKDRVCSEF
jgi:diguanylate cyclase (GGDEF)-like protein/PAS domain S-box-containing protein